MPDIPHEREEGHQDGPSEAPDAWRGWVSAPEHGSGWDFPHGYDDPPCFVNVMEGCSIFIYGIAALAIGYLIARIWR